MDVATRPLSVLVVDDEQFIAKSLATIFRNHGFDATCAYSGYDAIRSAKSLRPDVIISDILMPGMNGVDAAVSIFRHLPDAKYVFVSGFSGFQENLSAARNQGLEFLHLEKPVPPKLLVEYLAGCRRQNQSNHDAVCQPDFTGSGCTDLFPGENGHRPAHHKIDD